MCPVDDIFVPPIFITSLCRDTISARTIVGHSLLLSRLPGTHWVTICVIRRLALTVSDVFSRLVCFQSTSTSSALEVLHSMRYINLRFTYLLTYLPICHYTMTLIQHANDLTTSVRRSQLSASHNFACLFGSCIYRGGGSESEGGMRPGRHFPGRATFPGRQKIFGPCATI